MIIKPDNRTKNSLQKSTISAYKQNPLINYLPYLMKDQLTNKLNNILTDFEKRKTHFVDCLNQIMMHPEIKTIHAYHTSFCLETNQ